MAGRKPLSELDLTVLEEMEAQAKAGAGTSPRRAIEDFSLEELETMVPKAAPPTGLEDTLRSIPSGLKSGMEGNIGGMEDMSQAAGRKGSGVISSIARWLGGDFDPTKTAAEQQNFLGLPMGPEQEKALEPAIANSARMILNPLGAAATGVAAVGGPDFTDYVSPSTAEVKAAGEEAIPGLSTLNYTPQYTAGKYAQTGAEFASGAVLGRPNPKLILQRAMEAAGAGLVSEGAGQATAGLDIEPWARFAGGLGGGTVLSSNLLRRGPPTPEAQAQLDRGNVLTAGQAVGDPSLQAQEQRFGGKKYDATMGTQDVNYGAQVMEGLGAPAGTRMNPDTMSTQLSRIQGALDTVENNVGNVVFPRMAQQEMLDAAEWYRTNAAAGNTSQSVNNVLQTVGRKMRDNGGPMLTGPQIAELRLTIRNNMQGAEGQTLEALRKMQAALDGQVERHLVASNSPLVGEWRTARTQYRLYSDAETSMGMLSAKDFANEAMNPDALKAGTIANEGNRRFVTGQSENTAQVVEGAKAMPKRGDSASAGGSTSATIPGAILTGNPAHAAAVLAAPTVMGRVLMSKPIQKLLMSGSDNARVALNSALDAMREYEENRRRSMGR